MPNDANYRLVKYRGVYAIAYTVDGVRKRQTTRTADRTKANQALDSLIKDTEAEQVNTHTVGELWEMNRLSLGSRPSATTMNFEWRKLAGSFQHLLPSQITEAICLKHSNARLAAGRSPGTVWTELGRLRMVFAHAVKRNLLTKAPYIPRPQQPKPRELYLRPGEISNLLGETSAPHLRLFVTLAWSTGARAAALLGLKWSSIDFDRGMINLAHLGETRRMKGRAVVPMNETARAALVEAFRSRTAHCDHVIAYNDKPVASVKKALKAAGKRAGCPWVSPHVFRHSAAVAMAEARIPMTEIASYLGHKDSRLTERVYAKFSPDHLRQAAGALELGGSEARLRAVS